MAQIFWINNKPITFRSIRGTLQIFIQIIENTFPFSTISFLLMYHENNFQKGIQPFSLTPFVYVFIFLWFWSYRLCSKGRIVIIIFFLLQVGINSIPKHMFQFNNILITLELNILSSPIIDKVGICPEISQCRSSLPTVKQPRGMAFIINNNNANWILLEYTDSQLKILFCSPCGLTLKAW